EEPAAERAERDESDPELAQRRNHVVLVVARPQRVFRLQRRNGMNRVRAANRIYARLRQSEVADFSLAYQLSHRTDGFLDRHLLVYAMLVVEIDVVDAEALQRRIAGGAHVLGTAVDRALAVGQDLVGELGRDDDAVAIFLERFADQLFVMPDTVNVGGVEEVDAELDCALERRGGFVVVAWTVKLRHPHASEAQRRHFESLRAKFSLFHD